jgi:hypothetical protein
VKFPASAAAGGGSMTGNTAMTTEDRSAPTRRCGVIRNPSLTQITALSVGMAYDDVNRM